ncbi:MAG: HAD-IIB family hydrolase [Thomasclavelia sp.]|jgi:Cof subfamily protein (haloacid dehalogenase superfamily)|nr:HAD-IIB family hydrolase [Thomasclavelia sp.]
MKALASDFDNTFYFKDVQEKYHQSDIDAIKQFQKKGNLFGLCTGRPLALLTKPLKGLLEPDFYIISTGSLILDKNYQVLYKEELDKQTASKIYNTYRNEIECIACTLSKDKFYFSTNEREDKDLICFNKIEDVQEKIFSISLVESTRKRALEIAEEILQKYDNVDAYVNIDSVDIVPKGCSKGDGVNRLRSILNISSIMGIGDSYNDLPMLEEANTAFTFDYSPKEIQKKADYVVSSINEAIQKIESEDLK